MKINYDKLLIEYLNRNKLDLAGEKVIIGVSCGLDSSVLLDILSKKSEELRFEIIVCHVNHKRRAQSENEEEYIRSYCDGKYKFYCLHLEYNDVIDKENVKNFQEYARIKRIEFFKNVAKEEKCKYLFLAHHLNDDIETSFMHLLRGGSLKSIAGIDEVREQDGIIFLRPLLNVLKDDLYEYAKENNVKYFEDSTNFEDDYTRNRVRHNIVNELFKENPSFNQNFLSFKKNLNYATNLLYEKRDNIIKDIVLITNEIEIDYVKFMKLDDFMKREVLFEVLKKYDFSKVNILEIIKIISSAKPSLIVNYKTISIRKYRTKIIITDEIYKKQDIDIRINGIGKYIINDKMIITVSQITKDDRNRLKSELKIKNNLNEIFISNINLIWYNTNMLPLQIRSRKDGDTILLDNGHKKVKDLLIDEHIDVALKDDYLIMLDNQDDIISVLGLKKGIKIRKMGLDNCDIKIEINKIN